jgi:hypothetical protein
MVRRLSAGMKPFLPTILSLAGLAFFFSSRAIPVAMAQRSESRVWIEFKVVDGGTSQPLRGATVQLMNPFDEEDEPASNDENVLKPTRGFELEGAEFKPMLTDERGLITVKPDFDIGITINNLWTGSRVKLAGWRVRVSAPGYSPCTFG